ncbi:MAG: PHP domain-containing protein [Gammaproteobacteria bacterium]
MSPAAENNADLHCHSDASDGALSPTALVRRAAARGVDLLAITDHDTVDGVLALAGDSLSAPRLVPGIELTARWRRIVIHVVGLAIDPVAPPLVAGCARQAATRERRARLIDQRLVRQGIEGAYAGARARAGTGVVTRPHFAAFLVETGAARSHNEAFSRFLGGRREPGRLDDWPTLGEAIGWIAAAGGVAVLAHPDKYGLTLTRRHELFTDFAAAGGAAAEVVCGRQTAQVTDELARLCQRHGLRASRGSDFHAPHPHAPDLGAVAMLPASVEPVWSDWI